MPTDPTRSAGIFGRVHTALLVARRRSYLERCIAVSRHTRVAWGQELAHIKRTGRLDWTDPNPVRVHSADSRLMPPPPR